MNITKRDYENFIRAYNKLSVKFSIGNYKIKNLNFLKRDKAYEKIISEYSNYIESSFEVVEKYWKDEGGAYERSISARIEEEEYEKYLSATDKYKFMFNEVIDEIYPSFEDVSWTKDMFASLYFYKYPEEYKAAKKLFLGKLSVSTTISKLFLVIIGLSIITAPFIHISNNLSEIWEIRGNGYSSIATVIDSEYKLTKKKKGGTGIKEIEVIEFDGIKIKRDLPSNYKIGDQFTISYYYSNPNNFYVGKLDDPTLSVLLNRYKSENYLFGYFVIIWLFVSIGAIVFGIVKMTKNKEIIVLSIQHAIGQVGKYFNTIIQPIKSTTSRGGEKIVTNVIIVRILKLSLIILLLVALSGEDYSFYVTLRWLLFITIPYILYRYFIAKDFNWLLVFLVIWLVFNPIIPFAFDRDIWVLIDLTTIIALIVSFFFENKISE